MSISASHSAFPWISAASTSRTLPAWAKYVAAFVRISSSVSIGRVSDWPDGSPIRAVKSPMMSTATWPASWNCRSFRSTTACPSVRSGRLGSTPSFTRSGRPAASRSSRPPFGTRSTLPLASVVSTSAAMARRCYQAPPRSRARTRGTLARDDPPALPPGGLHGSLRCVLCCVRRPPGGRPSTRARADVVRVCGRRQRDHASCTPSRIAWSCPTSQIPSWIRDAAVAIEDRRFYQHHGIDGRAILRASYVNLRDGSIEEGGSTITQQLVKNLYTGGDRTLARKLSEASLAWQLEDRLSKEEILTRYLNTVYFGQGAYGVQAAARTFFGVDATDLNLAQSALLAGSDHEPRALRSVRVPAPGDRETPRGPPPDARVRHDHGRPNVVTRGRAPIRLHPVTTLGRYDYPYFVDYLKEWFLTQPRLRRDARGSVQAPVHRRPPDPHDAPAGRAGASHSAPSTPCSPIRTTPPPP